MATLVLSSKPYFSQPLTDFRSLLPYSFSRLTLTIDVEKPLWTYSISSRRRRECGITSASRWRCWTASTSAAFVHDDIKRDFNGGVVGNDEEEEQFVPLREMTRWLQNKPAGFGEGKSYDTTLEEKILAELERSRKKPMVSTKENAGTVKKQVKQNEICSSDDIKCNAEVRVGNLPKKKNIDRDLWKAFKVFPGITTISPAISGNRKTRDPICRGFAVVGFESDDAAYRFVQKYSNQNLLFGKVQKQISCDILNGKSVVKSSDSCKVVTSFDPAEHWDEVPIQLTGPIKKASTVLLPNVATVSLSANEATETSTPSENSSLSSSDLTECESKVVNKVQEQKKVRLKRDKTKPTKPSKPRVPGSLVRLKIKERAVLTDVFSKYSEIVSSPAKKV